MYIMSYENEIPFTEYYKKIFYLILYIFFFVFQKFSRRLSSCQDNVCMAMKNDSSLYAVGCRSYTLLLDSRTLHTIKKIPARYSGCGLYILIFIKC